MQRKPVDVGNGAVFASFSHEGSLLSVGTPHPQTGIVELTAAPQFPAKRDGDGDAVREHRSSLTRPDHAVLATVEGAGRLVGDRRWTVDGPGWHAQVDTWPAADQLAIVQRYRLTRHAPGRFVLVLTGRIDRPGYAEITPVGPIPAALPGSRLTARGAAVDVRTSHVGSRARAVVTTAIEATGTYTWPEWKVADDTATLELSWGPDDLGELELQVTISLTGSPATSDEATANGFAPTSADRRATLPPASRTAGPLERISRGAIGYTASCTAVPVAPGCCCILTDHRLLPLSWTRDAYYQAAMMLSAGNGNMWPHRLVEEHLAWLWGPGRDPDGVWQRSHFANGAVKDPAYQADQQLYPLLELADYRRVTGSWPRLPDPFDTEAAYDPTTGWGQMVRDVWQSLPRGVGGMIPGDENPADDSATFPYLLSSQLLLCHTARRMAQYEHELGVQDLALGEDARATLAFTRSAFACDGPFGPQWAYECDGGDGRRLYHDANDVPTAVAPLWGLCSADDPLWRTTMRFAWSAHNPGYVAGLHGGLGSAHTAGVWPLGDAQEWIVARTIGDQDAEARLLAKFELVASDDGMLPETYDPDTGAWMARHWFAWPGSLVGLLHHTVDRGTGPWTADRGDGLPIPGYSPAESVDGRAVC
jgi:hypothetical protein